MLQLTFERAANLWFLLALPLLVVGHFLFLRRIQKKALVFANFRALKRITGKRLMTRNYLVLCVRVAILLFAILGVSGITLWYTGISSDNDFVLAIDSSASMSAEDIEPTRLEAAKSNAIAFLDGLPGEASIGVVSFSGASLIAQPPTTDIAAAKEAIASIAISEQGGTDIPSAIITATNLLVGNEDGRVVIIITDGSSTIETGLDDSLRAAIAYAKSSETVIHTIGIGTRTGPIGYLPKYYNVSAVYNDDNLVLIANATGGVHASVSDEEAIDEAFRLISADTAERRLRRDLAPTFMLLALALLFAEWVLINTRFRSLP